MEGGQHSGIIDVDRVTQSSTANLESPTVLDTAMQAFRQAVSTIPGPSRPFHAETESWLSLPFIPRQYDIELLELLIGIAQRHLTTVFESFKSVTANEERLPVELIALASCGAMFSACAGGFRVGRLYFNDAHRMVSAYIAASSAMSNMSAAELASLLRSLLLLELFGLCSGFDRAYTLREAYHPALLQVAVEYCEAMEDTCRHSDTIDCPCSILIYDLLLLDSYRVAIFQLRPMFHRFKMKAIRGAVTRLESSSPSAQAHGVSDGNHHLLSCIVPLSYFARIYCARPACVTSSNRWSPQTVEFYMHKLLTRQQDWWGRSPSWEILAYTALWVMRAPIELIHEVATDAARDNKSPDPETATLLSQWHRSDHFLVVFGHIEHVLAVAEKALKPINRHIEAPHEAMGIYLAGLVIWSSRFATWKPDHLRTLRMERVIDIVSRYRVFVARSLVQILYLLKDIGQE